jgi:hypothetical protein
MIAMPDPASFTVLPWKPTVARFACDVTVEGEPWPYCPRTILRNTLERAKALGFELKMGAELEYFLLRRMEDGGITLADPLDTLDQPCYDMRALTRNLDFVSVVSQAVTELGWDNYGPALLSDVRAAVDARGKLVALEYQAWTHATAWFETASQLALGTPPPTTGFGAEMPGPGGAGLFSVHLSQTDMYDVPNRRIVNHRIAGAGYLRTGALRAPMDPSTFFALEGAMDELAHVAKLDSYEFRKRNISNERWLGVLKAAADAAKWTPRVAASALSSARIVSGRGIALGTHHLPQNQGNRVTYAAAVVDIEVNKDTGVVVAKHVYGAMDCGLAINPGIVESQIVGMSVHGASLALHEEVRFDETHVTSVDWSSYPTMRFGNHPAVTPIVVQRLHEQSSGAGEEVLPAVVAAIGNAFFDATGVRLRQYPLTSTRVLAALESRGVSPTA